MPPFWELYLNTTACAPTWQSWADLHVRAASTNYQSNSTSNHWHSSLVLPTESDMASQVAPTVHVTHSNVSNHRSASCRSAGADAERRDDRRKHAEWGVGGSGSKSEGGRFSQSKRPSDNLITASTHCNGRNTPAEPWGGAGRPSAEIAPRAGPALDRRGPSRQKIDDGENPHFATAHDRFSGRATGVFWPLPHNTWWSRLEFITYVFIEALIVFTKLLQFYINGCRCHGHDRLQEK